jgi:hypothetical protein
MHFYLEIRAYQHDQDLSGFILLKPVLLPMKIIAHTALRLLGCIEISSPL